MSFLRTCRTAALALLMIVWAGGAGATTTTVGFDDVEGGCVFAEATALRQLAGTPGLAFLGERPNDGGSVMSECASFGIAPRSGDNFLAFNRGAFLEDEGRPRDAETIVFAVAVADVSIWASGGLAATRFEMQALGADAGLLAIVDVDVAAGAWGELRIQLEGIARVVLREVGGDNSFVFDDLRFATAIPEPGTASLLALAVVGIAFIARRGG